MRSIDHGQQQSGDEGSGKKPDEMTTVWCLFGDAKSTQCQQSNDRNSTSAALMMDNAQELSNMLNYISTLFNMRITDDDGDFNDDSTLLFADPPLAQLLVGVSLELRLAFDSVVCSV